MVRETWLTPQLWSPTSHLASVPVGGSRMDDGDHNICDHLLDACYVPGTVHSVSLVFIIIL